MMKFTNKGQTLLINLNNTYFVQATAKWNFEKEKYDVELFIRRKDITMFDEVDQFELTSTREGLFKTLVKDIEDKYANGYFNKSIERYEYYIKCLEIGIDTFENRVEKNV